MKTIPLLISALAAALLATAAAASASAQQRPPPTIQLVSTFDLPGYDAGLEGINLQGDIVGTTLRSNTTYAIARSRSGSISKFQFGSRSTSGSGINSSRTICGDYFDESGTFRSFLYNGGVYTPYEPPAPYGPGAQLTGINDAGDVTGLTYDSQGQPVSFLTRDGIFIPIDFEFDHIFANTQEIN